jgi:alpha-tubulin suppressor-like RCC1 family protein
MALSSTGQVYTWGANDSGQLGDNSTTLSKVPVAVSAGAIPAGTTITRIAALGWGGTALGSTGQLYTWGYNSPGRLGNNTTPDSPVPVTASQPVRDDVQQDGVWRERDARARRARVLSTRVAGPTTARRTRPGP